MLLSFSSLSTLGDVNVWWLKHQEKDELNCVVKVKHLARCADHVPQTVLVLAEKEGGVITVDATCHLNQTLGKSLDDKGEAIYKP